MQIVCVCATSDNSLKIYLKILKKLIKCLSNFSTTKYSLKHNFYGTSGPEKLLKFQENTGTQQHLDPRSSSVVTAKWACRVLTNIVNGRITFRDWRFIWKTTSFIWFLQGGCGLRVSSSRWLMFRVTRIVARVGSASVSLFPHGSVRD